MTTTLEQQFHDHVNEGAVVRWPRYVLGLGVRTPTETGNGDTMRMFISIEVDAMPSDGHMTRIPLVYPILLREGDEAWVAIDDLYLRRIDP